MKSKKIFYIVSAMVCVFSFVTIYNILTTPNIDLIYEYKDKAYIQNSKSIVKKEIVLRGYNNIKNIIVVEDGWFCTAKKGDNNVYFLFVSKENEVTELAYNGCRITVEDFFMYNGMYSLIVDCFESENDISSIKLLLTDFTNSNIIIQNVPEEFTAYSILSNGNCLWGSNGDKIFKYENDSCVEITDGESVIAIQGNNLFFENNDKIYKFDLLTKEIVPFEVDINLYDYRTVDFESKLIFTDDYIVGCKIGFLKYSDGSASVTHTAIFDVNNNKSYSVYGSIGKVYKNIQILTNRSEYEAFT